ncbi:protein-glutamate O-methyltransferase CheR, partial [Pseudomonas sp. MWU13-2860]
IKRRRRYASSKLQCENMTGLKGEGMQDATAMKQVIQLRAIPVSGMCRDHSHFLAIREEVVPLMRTYPLQKIWIAGGNTGEKVYSMAILLREEGLLARTIIYATDINPRSLDKAKQRIFSMENVRAYTANYQQAGGQRSFADYYTAAYGYAIFDKSLCENVTF